VSITLLVITFILLLPQMLPKRGVEVLSDNQLRQRAISTNMLPIPRKYEELLKVVDNPQNPMTAQKIALGKELYNENLLSRDRDIACASCHLLEQGGDDNLPTAIGHQGKANPFHLNSPTVLNASLAKSQFWNGSAKDVEEQAGGPIQAPFEMNMKPEEVVERLNALPSYVAKFQEVFNYLFIFQNIKNAICWFDIKIFSFGDYDRFLVLNYFFVL
jgi:cytochrome c peroxidase